MRKYILITALTITMFSAQKIFTQSPALKSAELIETVQKSKDSNKHYTSYEIRCKFVNAGSSDSGEISNKDNWKIIAGGERITPDGVQWRKDSPGSALLLGPFHPDVHMTVFFLGGEAVEVSRGKSLTGTFRWSFGEGKPLKVNIQRLTTSEALWSVDYDFNADAVGYRIMSPTGSIYLRSLGLNLSSLGTFGNKGKVRNGTQSTLGINAESYFIVGGFVYRGGLNLGAQLATEVEDSLNKWFSIINKQVTAGLEVEIPFTNYPVIMLQTVYPYARAAMPLTLNFGYFFEGEDGEGISTYPRFDFRARYELALSPYFILQGEWDYSKFFNTPDDFDNTAEYYSLAVAQDLDVVKRTLGILKFILGSDEELSGKNFIFYRISRGRQAPAFKDISESSVGFGVYF